MNTLEDLDRKLDGMVVDTIRLMDRAGLMYVNMYGIKASVSWDGSTQMCMYVGDWEK